jgi:small-conductance mechanosensitive channel
MSRSLQRAVSLIFIILGALTQFLLQPGNLAVFSSPATAAVILGAIGVVVPIVTNALPTIWQERATIPPGD